MDYSGYRTPDCLRREPKEVQDFYVLMVEKNCVWKRVKDGLIRLSAMTADVITDCAARDPEGFLRTLERARPIDCSDEAIRAEGRIISMLHMADKVAEDFEKQDDEDKDEEAVA